MAAPQTNTPPEDGFSTITLDSWSAFHDVVRNFLELPHFVFRGHRMSSWRLESSLSRIIKDNPSYRAIEKDHLNNFILASRGRRGPNPTAYPTEDGWWSLGQHHGLATPLLDWTLSPYVALFFALADEPSTDQTEYVAVFALNRNMVNKKCASLPVRDPDLDDDITFVQPVSDENLRLVAQAGIFSRSPIWTDIETLTKHEFKGLSDQIALLKILIPHSDRIECLKALNIMNINYSSLFPDIYGAAKHSNELLPRMNQ